MSKCKLSPVPIRTLDMQNNAANAVTTKVLVETATQLAFEAVCGELQKCRQMWLKTKKRNLLDQVPYKFHFYIEPALQVIVKVH